MESSKARKSPPHLGLREHKEEVKCCPSELKSVRNMVPQIQSSVPQAEDTAQQALLGEELGNACVDWDLEL